MVSVQSCRYSRLPASLASQLPQGCMCQVRALWEPACWRWLRLNPADAAGCLHRWQASSHEGVCVRSGPCGSQLAGDGFGSILQIQPVACIAGKPVPTRVYVSGPGPVGASLLAMASAQSCRYSRLPASLASQFPQGCMCQVRALWEPACWRWLRLNPADTAGCLHRWQASSHKGVCVRSGPCGSQLAGDGFGSILQIQPVACIAGKPAPTRVYVSGPGPVGASLLAMASAQSCRYSRLPASLAASSHKGVCVRSGPCGSRLAGDGFGSILQIQPVACIAGKPAPTRVYVSGSGPVGASLLAMVSVQSCRYSRLPASLAASSHKGVCVRSGPCGSQLAGDGFGSILQIQPVACIACKPAPTSL